MTKFHHVISQLDQRYAEEVDDLITSPPQCDPYTTIINKPFPGYGHLSIVAYVGGSHTLNAAHEGVLCQEFLQEIYLNSPTCLDISLYILSFVLEAYWLVLKPVL
jgi:hypothetical protein